MPKQSTPPPSRCSHSAKNTPNGPDNPTLSRSVNRAADPGRAPDPSTAPTAEARREMKTFARSLVDFHAERTCAREFSKGKAIQMLFCSFASPRCLCFSGWISKRRASLFIPLVFLLLFFPPHERERNKKDKFKNQ